MTVEFEQSKLTVLDCLQVVHGTIQAAENRECLGDSLKRLERLLGGRRGGFKAPNRQHASVSVQGSVAIAATGG